jgi:hypothetical protein
MTMLAVPLLLLAILTVQVTGLAANVLFIAVDDLRPEHNVYGGRAVTPNVDAFAKARRVRRCFTAPSGPPPACQLLSSVSCIPLSVSPASFLFPLMLLFASFLHLPTLPVDCGRADSDTVHSQLRAK